MEILSPGPKQPDTAKLKRRSSRLLVSTLVGLVFLAGIFWVGYKLAYDSSANGNAYRLARDAAGLGEQQLLRGEVTKVSRDSITVRSDDKKTSTTAKVTVDTKVSINSANISIDDVAVGRTVILYSKDDKATLIFLQ